MNTASPTLRERLGQQIREYLKRGAVRQRELAQKLGISGSAVSQMIHGRIVPNSAQLRVLGEMLNLNRSERCELTSILARIRVNDDGLRSRFNDLLTELRVQRHMDRRELAELSGVTESQLLGFENLFDACPTPDELKRLSRALQIDAGILAGALRMEQKTPAEYESTPLAPVSVAEPAEPYKSTQTMPEILLSMIQPDFDGKDISMYAAVHSQLVADRAYPASWVRPVQISATGRDLSLPCSARIELVVADTRPANCGKLDLCRTAKGGFFLVDAASKRDKVLRFCGTTKMSGRILWRLPVLEILFRPVYRAENGEEA